MAKRGKNATYERIKESARIRNAEASAAGRDIGPLPPVADPARREAARSSFRAFAESYMASTFRLAWSRDHLSVIERIEQAVLHGGLFAFAMPRGSGKTSLCEAACVWALVYGHRRFVVLIGSDEESATEMLESIAGELEHNDELAADFPEVCIPLRRLEGIHQRTAGQTCDGERTMIEITTKSLRLPTVAGSAASGSVVRVTGITGRIRGMKAKRADGESMRPDLVLVDDPQTDESARSPSQCLQRERVLAGAVLGLAGPGRRIAGLMTLTVIRAGDMADSILDVERHPTWQGRRMKLVYRFPTNTRLWAEYAAIRERALIEGRGLGPATEFYAAHRAEMDDGAEVAWPERFEPGELSAIQHAMNLRLRSESAFFAEYQNEPVSESVGGHDIDARQVVTRLSSVDRGVVPLECEMVTAMIDVHDALLYYAVAAWSDGFGGSVIDYGAFPDQGRRDFTLLGASPVLRDVYRGASREAAVRAGLLQLVSQLCGRTYRRLDGVELHMRQCLIDAGFLPEVVADVCRSSPHASVLMPSRGVGITAASRPMTDYNRAAGDRVGYNWYIPRPKAAGDARVVRFDANFWKTLLSTRLMLRPGDVGAVTLYGESPHEHRMLADHLASEYSVETRGHGRTLREWRMRPTKSDNHLLDCVVGSMVAASVAGAGVPGVVPQVRRVVEKRRTIADLQRDAITLEARWAGGGDSRSIGVKHVR